MGSGLRCLRGFRSDQNNVVIDVDWHPWASHTSTSAYHHLADLADVLEKRSLAWFNELNVEEHERFAAELEGDALKLAAIAKQIRATSIRCRGSFALPPRRDHELPGRVRR